MKIKKTLFSPLFDYKFCYIDIIVIQIDKLSYFGILKSPKRIQYHYHIGT
jgi:hypothetical protein